MLFNKEGNRVLKEIFKTELCIHTKNSIEFVLVELLLNSL